MKPSQEEIREILAIVERSTFDTIEIQVGEVRIAASKSGASAATAAAAPARAARPAPEAAADPSATPPAPPPPAVPAEPDAVADADLIPIRAPIVGTFYAAPEPGAAPFVQVGQPLDPDTSVGIIEVMKVFSTVRAGLSGTLERCLVENGDFVEFDQPIFLVRPEA